jgi:uncharacterized LabA/DUF88 family protein
MNFNDPAVPPRFAILVDGENVSTTYAQTILKEVGGPSRGAIRRVYGKAEHIAAWDAEGFRLVTTRPGKNAADLLLCIEAMALAGEGVRDFALVTSDGDFVYLAHQLRELGCRVTGLGEDKAPKAFRTACTAFVTLKPATNSAQSKWPPTKIIPQIREILEYTNRPEGWGDLAWIGFHLHKRDAEFDSRNYGSPTLEALVETVKYFEIARDEAGLRLRDPNRREPPAAS